MSTLLRLNAALEIMRNRQQPALPFREIAAATHTLAADDVVLHVTYTTTGTVAITLPSAQQNIGRCLLVKDGGGGAETYNITVGVEGSETIDGSSTFVLNEAYQAISLYSNGANWFVW